MTASAGASVASPSNTLPASSESVAADPKSPAAPEAVASPFAPPGSVPFSLVPAEAAPSSWGFGDPVRSALAAASLSSVLAFGEAGTTGSCRAAVDADACPPASVSEAPSFVAALGSLLPRSDVADGSVPSTAFPTVRKKAAHFPTC